MADTDTKQSRVALRVKGRVQGVGFRFSAINEATGLGVTGWVRNTAGGDVEIVAEGPDDRLQRLVSWCQHGPRGAVVTGVEQQWLPYRGEFEDFSIQYRR